MSIVYRWDVPDHVLWVNVGAKMTFDNICEMDSTLIGHLDATENTLHIIFDNTELSAFPTDIRVLAANVTFPKHPNMGWRVIYGESRFVRYLGELSSKITGTSRLRYVDDLATAFTFLKSIDNTLAIPKATS